MRPNIGKIHPCGTVMGHDALFFGGGDLVGHVGDIGHRFADAGEGVVGFLHALDPFVGHYGKAAAHFAGTGGFDGGVEGQQVGLVGDTFDHVNHATDFVAVLGQPGADIWR
jgi:hypothetical protein